MFNGISPFQFSGLYGGFYVLSPFAVLPSALWGSFGVPLATYAAAQTAASWAGTGEYVPGWANRFFADRAPTLPSQPKGRDDYINDIKKKGYSDSESAAIHDHLMSDKPDDKKRQLLTQLGEVKTDRLHDKDKQAQREMMARAGAARALGVGNEEDLQELLKKYQKKSYEDFLDAIKREIPAS